MADIRLISILPSPTVQGVPSSANNTTSQTSNVQITLPAGTTLSGFIVNRDAGGNPILRSDSGDITFASNYFLKIGSEVAIRIESLQGHAQARILTINGLAPELAMQQSSFPQEPEVIVGSNAKDISLAPFFLGSPAKAPTAAQLTANPLLSFETEAAITQNPSVTLSATLLTSARSVYDQPLLPAGTALSFKLLAVNTASAQPQAEGDDVFPGFAAAACGTCDRDAKDRGGFPTAFPTESGNAPVANTPKQPPAVAAQPTTWFSAAKADAVSVSGPTVVQTPATQPAPATTVTAAPAPTAAPVEHAQQPAATPRTGFEPFTPASIPTPPSLPAAAQRSPQLASLLPEIVKPAANPLQPQVSVTTTQAPAAPQTAVFGAATPVTTVAVQTPLANIPIVAQATVNSLLPSGQTVTAYTPSQSQLPPLPPLSNVPRTGDTMVGIAMNPTPMGESVIYTPLGMVRLQPGITLPPGTQVTLEMSALPTGTAAETAAAASMLPSSQPATIVELARQWTSLSNIFSLLIARDESFGLEFTPINMPVINTGREASPSSPHSVPAGVMMFMMALKGGDFRDWIGRNTADWLENNGHGDLMRRAAAEFSTMGQQLTNPPAQQTWQPLFFPVLVDGELVQTRFFTKRDRKKDPEGRETGEEDTRFVVEVEVSQLGEMQLDGFVRKREEMLQFDMVLRSHIPLPSDVQQDILQIYNETGQLTGYRGSLVFQNVKEFPVHPMEELAAQGGVVMA